MASIPEDVASLKRQELQRLCKAHKIKANMKNTEMIQALQERRQQMSIKEEDRTEEILEANEKNSELEDEMAVEVKSKSMMEKEDRMTSEEKVVEKRTNKATVEMDSTTIEEKCTMKDDEVTDMEQEKDMTAMEDEEDNDMKLMEDKAVTMDTKIKNDAAMKDNDTAIEEDETANELVVENMSAIENTTTRRDQDDDAVIDTEEERTEQAEETENKPVVEEEEEGTMEAVGQHELVVEDSNGNTTLTLVAATEGDDDNILNTTYTIEPLEQLVDDPDDALSSSLLNPSCDSPSTLPQGAWALGPALRDSPLLRTHQAEKETTKENMTRRSAHDNVMALLNARVEERKQEPGYCPKEFVDTGPASRIPVRSDIAQQFDNVHKKRFNQMPSIKDELENRKRRRTPSQNPNNRPPLHEPLSKKPKSGPQPVSAPKIKPDPKKMSSEKRTITKQHKSAAAAAPSSKESTGRPISHKTPKMPLTKSQKTPHTQPSKRTLGYTPHKGPLPKYQDTASKIQ